MKKYLLLVLVIFSSAVFAQSGAKIEFKDKDNTIDYGTVNKEDDNGLRAFVFTNTGDAPLIIKDAKSTCGCTVPSFPKEPIAPGQSGKIEVKYNMNTGPIRKTITIETNAINYDEGRVALKIKGEVIVKPVVNLLEKKSNSPMMQ
ncbi:MAG: DUF1573 domain-containing protein [Flavobacterium sp.]|jgi:hypothetical protein|uniref:DUF1573 domain-containing protein n=1 Tax=Flavobacterium macrobrachii TaxID=591204 RepID=A0ABS2CUM9_9FLAO|nr:MULTISPECIES: DUF1573 domain-containing protein [Flavobacterium]MBM6498616.1 DUF1573 domain-containing protein [Flavobacterium macrobrachii]MCZ8091554.1 DUF1573 domain-containing protein [Flavobacterium sp.]MCZ8331047.1 DUF1573 domain-containing protein [Flavobacterium sp.]